MALGSGICICGRVKDGWKRERRLEPVLSHCRGVDITWRGDSTVRVVWEMPSRTSADDDGEDLRGTRGQWCSL